LIKVVILRTGSYIQLPTSAGKTEIMLAMILALCGTGQDIPRMFIVEPTKRLVRQTRDRLVNRFPEIPVGLYYSDEQELEKPLTIITWDSFYNLMESQNIKPEEVDYLFLDEAHRGLTDLRRSLLHSLHDTTVIEGLIRFPGDHFDHESRALANLDPL
jgi:superfamily II DNA or RNA helicase